MMKCTELLKNTNKSLVEIRNMETDKIANYVVCTNFDNSKAYGNKWDSGEYYTINDALGLYQQDMLRAAVFDLYGIKEPKIPYDRVMEFARAFFNNMDIDDEQADYLKDEYNITEKEAEEFGIKDKLFPRKYKIVTATFTRSQEVTINVIMPNDEPDDNVDNYVDSYDYLEDCPSLESYDWDFENYNVEQTDMDKDEVEQFIRYNDDVWNADDFPEGIY